MMTSSTKVVRRVGMYMLAPALLLIAPTCTNLTEMPHDALTPSTAFQTDAQVLAGVAGIYAELRPIDNNVGYIAIASFTDSTNLEVAFTVDSLVHSGATSLTIDLRNNPGGLLAQGVAVAELFLDKGQKVVSTKGRVPAANAAYAATSSQRWPNLPIIVLVNSGTASAAEIVAGALQDHDRAIVIGRPSYGKGSAQAVVGLPNGAALKITDALWYTPAGRSIDRAHPNHVPGSSPADTARPVCFTVAGAPGATTRGRPWHY